MILGDENTAVDAATKLREQNIFVPAIRYPTVARGAARLRVTLTAAHSDGGRGGTCPRAERFEIGNLKFEIAMNKLAQLDHKYVWHPFTQMRDWLQREPIVIASGKGAVLRDVQGRKYLDANSSIWTNLHGHQNPKINAAISRQLKKIAHSSALGFANEPASLLAEKLVKVANREIAKRQIRN